MNQNFSRNKHVSLEALTDEALESVCGGDDWGREQPCKADYTFVGLRGSVFGTYVEVGVCVPTWY